MRIRRWLAAVGLCALLMPTAVAAQETPWSVDLDAGAVVYQEASSLQTGWLVGLTALYDLSPNLSIGPFTDFVRVETDGSFFVEVLDFGADSSRAFYVGQRIHTLHYGAMAKFQFSPDARFDPYLVGGAGGYTMFLEGQSNDGFGRISNPMFQIGGGIHYAVSEATGIQIDVRDAIYTSFDREDLNPILPQHRNCPVPGSPSAQCTLPGVERDLPANEETLHNIRVSVGLRYIPGLNR